MKVFKALIVSALLISGANAADELSWLRDDSRSEPKVLNYLKEQNQSTHQYQAKIKPQIDSLLAEWQRNRPLRSQKPWREISGYEYTIQTRKGERTLLQRNIGGGDELELFNIEQRAAQFDYYQLGSWALNASRTQLAIAEDLTGSEQYQVSIVDLKTGKLQSIAERVEPSILWSQDEQSLFLVKQEADTSRPFAVHQVMLATQAEKVLYQELESAWLVSSYLTSDKQFAVVQSNSDSSSEQRLLNLASGELSAPVSERKQGVEYYLDKVGSTFYINSNHQNPNFNLYRVAVDLVAQKPEWLPLLNAENDERITNFYLFESGAVVLTQNGALQNLHFFDNQGQSRRTIALAESGQVAWLSVVGDFQSNKLHIRSMSMTQPAKWEAVDAKSLSRALYSQDQYPNYQASLYHTEQVMVSSGDQLVPVTLAYRKDRLNSTSPVLLYGYGAYGVTMKPYFMPQITSLLDQGMIYAIAHVRGGGFEGERWYQAGKGLNKQKGISDFIKAAEILKTFKHGQRPIFAMGASAGGTLVAAALNQKPTAFSGAVLKVPFVDVVNSMSDSDLPLTAQQYSEWGNPNKHAEREIMKKYDPYLNLTSQSYPPVLVQVGLNDRRVPYWEGAKFYEKLRSVSTGHGPYLLMTNFNQGHSTDRRQSLSQQAFEYAFFLSLIQQELKAEQ
ncbi:S9 family peptidase [Vibrio sp. T187]|uniref:prolyl oligopeptidase family serine peptidase n=1 Tax=Vibrio TaxID=662 RepID=UPI0010C99C20|nr:MULTISPECIES: prolyl oligopeptidase family serine peptidase [Vibrio]MBW3695454.1 S9 family peptidase [Vibrio sp. T187]